MSPLATTQTLQLVHALVRRQVPYQPGDRRLDREIELLATLVRSGQLSRFLD